ncbi:hypothetical protein [Devosia soli]|uniref:hypothetical protein n=1 Tax=Devosia soli TaxID=361041 RepID=UPI00128CFF10|nr:hypothetical protein [Devosia soli]
MRELVSASFDEIEAHLAKHTYEKVAESISRAGQTISANTLRQYIIAERKLRSEEKSSHRREALSVQTVRERAVSTADGDAKATQSEAPLSKRTTFKPRRPE